MPSAATSDSENFECQDNTQIRVLDEHSSYFTPFSALSDVFSSN
jgi:hypothetical protein